MTQDQRRKMLVLVALIVMMGGVATIGVFSLGESAGRDVMKSVSIGLTVLVAFGLTLSFFKYLGGDLRKISDTDGASRHGLSYKDWEILREEFEHLRQRITTSEKISESIGSKLTPEAAKAVAGLLNDQITDSLTEKLDSHYTNTLKKNQYYRVAHESIERIASRLSGEIAATSRRANINLFIGILFSLAAISVMTWLAISVGKNQSNITDVSWYSATRLSLAVFIQIFAFFFLRLYRGGINEVKYYQNEITNIESKASALFTALVCGNQGLLEGICLDLSKAERNFVLEKGQTTVSLEQLRLGETSIDRIQEAVRQANRESIPGYRIPQSDDLQ